MDTPQDLISVNVPAVQFSKPGEFKMLKHLGEGGQGAVYLVYHMGTARRFAEKILSSREPHANDAEAQISMALQHKYVVRTYHARRAIGSKLIEGVVQPVYQLRMIMERMEGTLANLVVDHYFDVDLIERAIVDLCCGLRALHRTSLTRGGRAIVHCDVKPDNVLVNHRNRCKLADFGMVTLEGRPVVGGTPITQAPELFDTMLNFAARPSQDMFSVGAIIYFILATPLGSRQLTYVVPKAAVTKSAETKGEITIGQAICISEAATLALLDTGRGGSFERLRVLGKCLLRADPGLRPTACQCIAFLKGGIPTPNSNVNNASVEALINEHTAGDDFDENTAAEPLPWTRFIGHTLCLLFVLAVIGAFIYAAAFTFDKRTIGGVYIELAIAVGTSLVVAALTFCIFRLLHFAPKAMLVLTTIAPVGLAIGVMVVTFNRNLYFTIFFVLAIIYCVATLLGVGFEVCRRMDRNEEFFKIASKLLSPTSVRCVLWPWVLGYLFQVCMLFVGGVAFGSELRNTTWITAIAVFIVYVWMLNFVRYTMHYIFIKVYNVRITVGANVSMLTTLRQALTDDIVGLCFCSFASLIAPGVLFIADFLRALGMTCCSTLFLPLYCAACGKDDRESDRGSCCSCCSCVCWLLFILFGTIQFIVGTVLMIIRTFLNMLSGLLTKTNLTQMALTQMSLFETIAYTYSLLPFKFPCCCSTSCFYLGDDSAFRDGIVTDSVGSSLIGHMCMSAAFILLFGAPLGQSDVQVFYGAASAYMLCSTALEPLDSYIYMLSTASTSSNKCLFHDIIHAL